ncbi:sulfatase [Vibrio sp. TH_r3]|uniref:sulfatase n=1 Tax=Vibrio sp. TH_r3 TaxID=3082084 RepID=UPI00295567F6|nr:sulfatase [Vibrio sp. TH_r3]MDV7105130.1 sulfatase [Vibrio sp. TH_r3]
MKAVVLMFDTLTKHHISTYGGDAITPNFERLAQHSVKFNNFYVGSMPCMPARREIHTGRYNFLHRSWGPLEPFDFSMPEHLSKNAIHTHLVTDHKHYWRDGGATYHPRYTTFEFIRGQEGDSWKGHVEKPNVNYDGKEEQAIIARRVKRMTQDAINRTYMKSEAEHTLTRTIEKGLAFLDTNHEQDDWFLQLECFDPHEPFFVPDKYLNMYGCCQSDFDGWMYYNAHTDTPEKQVLIRKFYQALITMCDEYLGKVLDSFDEHNLWESTMLMVCTDHGFLLGEHEWWGKNIMPVYNEIANTPFFLWDPRYSKQGIESNALAQTIDIPATLLDYFKLEIPNEMEGRSISQSLLTGSNVRDYALFGYFGAHINITDGKYIYMRAPRERKNTQNEYTLMPTHIDSRFTVENLALAELCDGFKFTLGAKVLKIPSSINYTNAFRFGDKLFDLTSDPKQKNPICDHDKALEMSHAINIELEKNEAPSELYSRYALESVNLTNITEDYISFNKYQSSLFRNANLSHHSVAEGLEVVVNISDDRTAMLKEVNDQIKNLGRAVNPQDVFNIARSLYVGEQLKRATYQLNMAMRYY